MELVLAVIQRGDDRVELMLAGAVLVEIATQPVAGPERQQAEQLARAEQVALPRGVELLDLVTEVDERPADRRGLGEAAVLHRRERLLEEPVRDGRGSADVLVTELPDVLDLVTEFGAVWIERGDGIEIARHHRIEPGAVGRVDRHRVAGGRGRDRRDWSGRLENQGRRARRSGGHRARDRRGVA